MRYGIVDKPGLISSHHLAVSIYRDIKTLSLYILPILLLYFNRIFLKTQLFSILDIFYISLLFYKFYCHLKIKFKFFKNICNILIYNILQINKYSFLFFLRYPFIFSIIIFEKIIF